jgi:hypothetical protein
MGYDLYSVETGMHFRANIFGMNKLRLVMADAGVALGAASESDHNVFTAVGPIGKPAKQQKANLGSCFCSNDGWVVTSNECNHIASCLGKWMVKGKISLDLGGTDNVDTTGYAPSADFSFDDMRFVQSFIAYCRGCIDEGGFKVH